MTFSNDLILANEQSAVIYCQRHVVLFDIQNMTNFDVLVWAKYIVTCYNLLYIPITIISRGKYPELLE